MKPHKHAELIKAWADGAEIQISVSKGELWEDAQPNFLVWNDEYQYRIKPEPKPDVVAVGIVEWNGKVTGSALASYYTKFRVSERHEYDNIKFTFDGETGELKSTEVLK